MIEFKARRALVVALITAGVLAGCANRTPADDQKTLQTVDSKAAFNVEQADWKKPFWESSDKDGDKESAKAPSFVKRDEPLSNVGLIVDDSVANALPQAISVQAAQHGLLVLPQSMLRDAMDHAKSCQQSTDDACLDSLAQYPGVRLLVHLTPGEAGKASARIQDTVLNKSYSETVSADAEGAARLLNDMAGQASMAAWSVQPFSGGEGNLYISAGRVNGLAVGTELAVREPGQPVRTPSGQVIAWHNGKIVGKAKVTQWVGATLSRITAESGTAPGPDYRLTLLPDDQ